MSSVDRHNSILVDPDTKQAYGRSELYLILRICERFGNWLKQPLDFLFLPAEDQARMLAYEVIRQEEEQALLCR